MFNLGSPVQSVVVNVQGTRVSFSGFQTETGGLASGLITWNFCSATSVTIRNFGFEGNLLAPLADVTVENAQIAGLVAARSLSGTGSGEVHLPTCPQ